MAEFRDIREKDQFKYKDRILAAQKRWQESDTEKAVLKEVVSVSVEDFLLWWDTLRRIEKEFGIDPWGIAREERWKHGYEHGRRMAEEYKEHGTKDLYDAYNATFEGADDAVWLEANDKAFHKWNRHCPVLETFRKFRSDEEIKEMAPLFCLEDQAIMTGFNPELDVFAQTRLIMAGDDRCVYRFEDNRKGMGKK